MMWPVLIFAVANVSNYAFAVNFIERGAWESACAVLAVSSLLNFCLFAIAAFTVTGREA